MFAKFETLVDRAFAAEADDPVAASDYARAATELWRGDVTVAELCDHPAVVRLKERRLGALEVRFRAELQQGRHGLCLADLLAACHAYPYAEDLWRTAMIALYRAGRQAEALALYREIRNRLVEDLGVEPGHSLRHTEMQVLTQDVPEVSSAPSPFEQPMGLALDADVPVPGSWLGFPRYDDRYFEDHDLAERFRQSFRECRHLTVTGTAGVGKSRLVVEQLPGLAARWPDGAAFCRLSSIDDGSAVGSTVAAATGARVPAGLDPTVAIAEHLSSGERLLVLDTCEHVSAAVAAFADELLRRCPALTIVATSRSPLGVTGELVFPMPSLDASTLGTDLFIDRTRRVQPGGSITADDRLQGSLLAARRRLIPDQERSHCGLDVVDEPRPICAHERHFQHRRLDRRA